MKSIIKPNSKAKLLPYPKLMIDSHGLVVIMDEPERGTVIVADEHYKIGTYLDVWDMSWFRDFDGTVELSN
jgi:hypothetical protein